MKEILCENYCLPFFKLPKSQYTEIPNSPPPPGLILIDSELLIKTRFGNGIMYSINNNLTTLLQNCEKTLANQNISFSNFTFAIITNESDQTQKKVFKHYKKHNSKTIIATSVDYDKIFNCNEPQAIKHLISESNIKGFPTNNEKELQITNDLIKAKIGEFNPDNMIALSNNSSFIKSIKNGINCKVISGYSACEIDHINKQEAMELLKSNNNPSYFEYDIDETSLNVISTIYEETTIINQSLIEFTGDAIKCRDDMNAPTPKFSFITTRILSLERRLQNLIDSYEEIKRKIFQDKEKIADLSTKIKNDPSINIMESAQQIKLINVEMRQNQKQLGALKNDIQRYKNEINKPNYQRVSAENVKTLFQSKLNIKDSSSKIEIELTNNSFIDTRKTGLCKKHKLMEKYKDFRNINLFLIDDNSEEFQLSDEELQFFADRGINLHMILAQKEGRYSNEAETQLANFLVNAYNNRPDLKTQSKTSKEAQSEISFCNIL